MITRLNFCAIVCALTCIEATNSKMLVSFTARNIVLQLVRFGLLLSKSKSLVIGRLTGGKLARKAKVHNFTVIGSGKWYN